tara:strand:- start:11779 stop:13104 length:1326 start_codon:yes stop_codon:yes gene_type:complete
MIFENRLNLNVKYNILLRIASVLINLALVPLTLNFLGVENYGIWLTIYSVIAWIHMFDFGLGNGLKLKLTEAFSKKRHNDIRKLISSAYITICSISAILVLLFLVFSLFIKWDVFFGIIETTKFDVNFSVIILFISINFTFVFKLVGVIYASLQHPFIDSLIKCIAQFLFLLLVSLFIFFNAPSLLVNIAFASTMPLVLIYVGLSLYFFLKKARFLMISKSSFCISSTKSILRPGLSFFIIQLCFIILHSTDNLIIINLIDASSVTNYNIAYKYFGLPFHFFTLYISTHWPVFIAAINEKKSKFIVNKIKLFKKIFVLLLICFIFMYYMYDFVVSIWINNKDVKQDDFLNIMMILYYCIYAFTTIYIYVVNASGKLKIQTYLYILIAIINIPLSIFFVKTLMLGSSGVILASATCLLMMSIIMPIQSSKLLSNKASGIWGK